ncbi:hypothetical protein ACEWY4_000293 [Coilia grayii]|uniref:protein-tyrosine-phosphatase n=1 Tax=Coilia grayii TaxID=363190 RepID=A0ABD1KWB1_9TELE
MEKHLLKFIHEASSRTSEDSLAAEYNSVRQQSIKRQRELGLTTEVGRLQENTKKNRYKDILPYDQTRVPLSLFTNENESDYINASFIGGAVPEKSYIATQGPLAHTVGDFWRMIWQYDVKVIIMACREVEMGKRKCENYWTSESVTAVFGDFTVTNLEESAPDKEVVVRTLVVKYHQDTHTIQHFQYTTWPDHSIPCASDGILHMLELARAAQGKHNGPILVHCSAGCGRTGVLCALDYVHDLFQKKLIKEDFSLMKIVLDIRGQRPSAVQTKEQYEFLFRTVVKMFEQAMRGSTANYENINEHRASLYYNSDFSVKPALRTSLSCGREITKRPPQPTPRKMNDTYAVVNKTKQPPASTLHHYDNTEFGGLKGRPLSAAPSLSSAPAPPAALLAPATSDLYSTVKPKGRHGASSQPTHPVPIYDMAGAGKQRLGEGLAVLANDHGDYEMLPGNCGPPSRDTQMMSPGGQGKLNSISSQDDDYEYVSCPLKDISRTADSFCSPGGMGFNSRIKKPKGPRDPPAEWSRAER